MQHQPGLTRLGASKASETRIRRVILIVLDSVGVGALPDAGLYGDEGSDTLGNMARALGELRLPNMGRLGLGNLTSILGTPPQAPLGACGRMALSSPGKDTTVGHWEIAGLVLEKPFKTYPEGFPPEVISAFEKKIGRKVLGNRPASGTEIIKELGEEHMKEGRPIVYTSQDSVFQIAAHEDVVHPDTLYRWCEIARDMLTGDNLVARVIARPFTGSPGNFTRTPRRRDFSLPPPGPTLLDFCRESGVTVVSVGKVWDIFAGRAIDKAYHTKNNAEGIEVIKRVLKETALTSPVGDVTMGTRSENTHHRSCLTNHVAGVHARTRSLDRRSLYSYRGHQGKYLIFANLVDFDMIYGHRNDVRGYARALLEFDRSLPEIMALIGEDDVLVVTADHGCDPTTPSTDHSREYVPVLVWGPPIRRSIFLGTRETLADLGATVASILGVSYKGKGKSFYQEVLVDFS